MKTIKDYYQLLADNAARKATFKEDKRALKRLLHLEYYELNKNIFRALDIGMILIILFNLGAVVITNALVVKVEPDIEFAEANPVQAELNDYQPLVDEQGEFDYEPIKSFFRQMIIWIIMIGLYVRTRRHTFTEEGLTMLGLIVLFWIVTTGLDFFHDLGFWVGVLKYGI
jgi:hypothetical protein|tara:strand:- start:4094 stop:4603 length:510 start_codon:yes stop_codon:yes gene_type:complete